MSKSLTGQKKKNIVKPGVLRHFIEVELKEEGTVKIPYFILQGKKPGPTLYVQAGEHGIEVNGMAVIHTFIRTFNPDEYSGRIIALPVANPLNIRYRHHTKNQPRAQGYNYTMPYNTYKRWPGRKDGDPAQRICHAITTSLLKNICGIINFHCWSWHSASGVCMSGYGGSSEKELGKVIGNPFWIWQPQPPPKTTNNLCLHEYASAALGIPGCLFELRTHWWILEESQTRGLRAIRNACRFFGMRSDSYEEENDQFCVSDKTAEAIINAPHDGLYVPRLPIESNVRKGMIIGDLYDVDEGFSTEIICPVNGKIWLNNRIGKQADLIYEDGHSFAVKNDILTIIKYNKN